MVIGRQLRIQQEVQDLLEKLPCPKMGKNVNEMTKILALFCLDCPNKFKEWYRKWEKNQLKLKK